MSGFKPISKGIFEKYLEQLRREMYQTVNIPPMSPEALPSGPPTDRLPFEGVNREPVSSFWIPAIHPTPPEEETEPAEVTPIPERRIRKCYRCGAVPAVARAFDEPAYCEEHRKKR